MVPLNVAFVPCAKARADPNTISHTALRNMTPPIGSSSGDSSLKPPYTHKSEKLPSKPAGVIQKFKPLLRGRQNPTSEKCLETQAFDTIGTFTIGVLEVSRFLSQRVTALLSAWCGGDEDAQDRLFKVVYQDLHRVAARCMARERQGHTLQATALVNEAYVRLVDIEQIHWQDRAHFFAVAARVMRHILVDSARARRYQKRGGGAENISLDEALIVTKQHGPDLVALDDALSALAALDERKSQVVELRFFGGLSVDETAEVLGVSTDTVLREWKMAKVWLLREIKRERVGR